MSLDPSSVAGSIAKSAELERTIGATQKASDVIQQAVVQNMDMIHAQEKASESERLRRDKIRRDKERRRREMEHRASQDSQDDESDNGEHLDLVA